MEFFTREDWKLFRNIDTLSQKAGVRKERIPALVVKEVVDNALDIAEDCTLLELQGQNGFSVQDNGPGIPPERLADLFSINRPMVSSKLVRLPTRGALGNGLRVVMGAVTATNGKLYVTTQGVKYELIPKEDGFTSVSAISYSSIQKGTLVEVFFGKNIEFTTHDLRLGSNAIDFAKGERFRCTTSPYWYTSEAFFELLNAYSGELSGLLQHFDPKHQQECRIKLINKWNRKTSTFNFEESEEMLRFMRTIYKQNDKPKIGYIGKEVEHYYNGYSKELGTFIITSARGKHDAHIPYAVETWVTADTRIEEPIVTMMVNKTPVTGEVNSYKKDRNNITIFGCGLRHRFKSKPAYIKVNVQTPHMPITSDGKAPNFEPMLSAIHKSLEKAARIATRAINNQNNTEFKTEKDVILHHLHEAIQKASGGGIYKFSQRQLYYAVRPYVITKLNKETDYNYFCRVLTEYESVSGDIKNLYRDPRGILYHPHLNEEIPIGTIAVENYHRPSWTFNKIIYSEKEGFFTILRDAKFPERYDCALLTSKGYASRAVKDLFDLLGDTKEEIYFYCIHDADAAGTKIYETLQGATMARPGRRIKVINLGLDPAEALEMNLEVEKVQNAKGRKPVAAYLNDHWKNWLQHSRVELNAMTSPQFLKWLESKMEEQGVAKVIPTNTVMQNELKTEVTRLVEQRIAQDILDDAGYEDQVKKAIKHLKPHLSTNTLHQQVQTDLIKNKEHHWKTPIKTLARKISHIKPTPKEPVVKITTKPSGDNISLF